MLRLICLVTIAIGVVSACGGSDDANKASPTASGSPGAAATAPDTATPTVESSDKPESEAFQAYKASVTGLYDAGAKPVPEIVTKAMGGCNDAEGTPDIYHLANDCSTVAQSIARDMQVTPAVQQSLQLQHDFMLSQIDALVELERTPRELADAVKRQVTDAPIWHPALTTPNPAAS